MDPLAKRVGANDAVAHLQVRLMPSEFVYPFRGVWGDLLGERHHDDVVIHAIAVSNGSSEVASVASITLEGTERGRLLQRVVLDRDEVEQRSTPVVARDRLGLRRLLDFVLWTDQVVPPGMALSSSAQLEPGHVLVVPNVYLTFHRRPDRLKVIVDVVVNGVPDVVEATLSVVEYTNRVKYGIPVEGTWLMKATPSTGVLDHHRFGVSNEFGVDFLRLGPQGEVFRNEGKQASDYFSYGERVLAAADGRVVAVQSAEAQDPFRFHPKEGETDERFRERQLRELRAALDGDVGRWAAGNSIVIEHADGEYSAYLHLKEHGVLVKEGDVVRRGQHIADVGNTGDSFGAHLHFQVIDRPDLVRGRSLPFEFEDLGMSLSEPGWFVHPAR
ncbi:MAG: M23 family metallopeptidase [Acidimicrobiia bacterium]